MSDLKSFFAENVAAKENVKFVVSDRFKDENGKPIEWELKILTAREEETIRADCTRRIPNPGKGRGYTEKFDSQLYVKKLITYCVIYPNLNSVELQNSYGVVSSEELLSTMLISGEYINLMKEVMEINKLSDDFDELVDEAKN